MRKWAVAVAAILLLLSGCNKKETSSEAGKKEEIPVKTEEKEEAVKTSDPYYYPLTGIGTDTKIDERAVAVMVNNHPKARPQSGLNQADIVYELLAEGDITRFLAVFQSEKPKNIGPVRSARDYYVELAKGLDALYVAHGWSEEAKAKLENEHIDNLNGMIYDGTLFKRSTTRKAPHNSYITYENILKGAEQKNYSMEESPPGFTFMSEEERGKITGNDANTVKITYSKSGTSDSVYEYDSALRKYKRFSGGEQSVDLDTNEPVLLDNLFIVEAVHKIIDSYGRRDIDLKSGGKAYLVQMGKVQEVEWANKDGRIVPIKNGAEVPFVQGKTWVNVVPTNPGLEASVSFNAQ
ncbi:DUF3048 domain-containing protein [Neobacillus jeddahensis]|uniref:DUF3048 domain-containing protein n=1 Tax=Neobacillus jeddahensis TaxID=1461580 RepID=UPI00058E93C9|nr:DUF3048 domain-containing protein [Neobacillus jeddahensis]